MLTIIIKDVASIDEAIQQLTQERRVVVTAADLEGQTLQAERPEKAPKAAQESTEAPGESKDTKKRRKYTHRKMRWTKEMEVFLMQNKMFQDTEIAERLRRAFGVSCSKGSISHRIQKVRDNKPRTIYIDGQILRGYTD